jgi:hypothetical protein
MRHSGFFQTHLALLSLLFATAAAAQPPAAAPPQPETVYSDAQREKDLTASRQTIETMLASAFSLENQYSRWKQPVCVRVFGLAPAEAWFVEHHIRQVAVSVGAPVASADPCLPNIAIFFTDEPQTVLDAIATARPFLVNGGNQKVLVRYPQQAWYASLKTDFNGIKTLDVPFEVANPSADCILGIGPDFTGNAVSSAAISDIMNTSAVSQTVGFCEMPFVRTNDSRLQTGVTTEMAATTVLVDSRTVLGMKLGEVGDYLAFLTLAQGHQTGACQPLPTIANLMSKRCAAGDTLSRIDMALLTALYEVPDNPALLQKQRLIGAMRRNLEAQFGKN